MRAPPEHRDRLLNATIERLHELGYHRTSTVIVTGRAGVSRLAPAPTPDQGAGRHQPPEVAEPRRAELGVAEEQFPPRLGHSRKTKAGPARARQVEGERAELRPARLHS